MHKYKWFDAKYGTSLTTLGKKLAKNEFINSNEDCDGFRLEFVNHKSIAGQYIEKENYVEKIVLPTGHEYEEYRSKITITDFLITDGDKLSLQLNDPPRRNLPFFNALSEACSYEFSCEMLEIDLLRWFDSIESIFGKIDVLFLECNGVQVSPFTVGRFAFKGTKDVRSEALKFISKKQSYIESARCSIPTKSGNLIIEICRNGSIKGPLASSSEALDDLRTSLLNAQI